MNMKEIQGLNDTELISSFYWIAIRSTNEVNSRRGLTKATMKEESIIFEEIQKRFNLDPNIFKDKIMNK